MKKIFENLNKGNILFVAYFALIILGGLWLRLSIINFPIWYDEGCSIATAINSFPTGINNYLWNYDFQHTPFYFYILHYIMQFFGDSEFILRISSVIISMLLLPLTYIVTTKLSSSKKIGLVAMLLMAVNTFQVLYSIEIRMYPYTILLALLSINYLIDYDRKGDIPSLVKLSVVNILNPYFLTGSIIFTLAEFIIYSSYLDYKKAEPKKLQNYIWANIITILCYIPYFIIVGHYAIVRSKFLITDLSNFEIMNLWGLLQNIFSADPGHIHETRHEGFTNNFQTIALIFMPLIVMFTGLINSLRDKEKLNTVILGIITLTFGIFLWAANAKVIAFTGRYLIFITPFVFILTAIGLSKFNKYVFATIIFIYSCLCIYGLHQTYETYEKIAYYSLKAPAEYVKKNYIGKNNLVIMPFASSVSFYYFKGKNMPRVMPLELFHEVRNPDNTNFYNEEQIQQFKTGDKYKVFQNIITSDNYISENFKKHMQSEIDKVPHGGYIIWIIYYTDNYALTTKENVQNMFRNYDNVKAHVTTGMLSKFDLDLIKILEPQARLIKTDRDESNSYIILQKR